MVTDQQVRRLFMLIQKEKSLVKAAAQAGMDEETARKYKKLCKLPSQVKVSHTWQTRKDPFEGVWEEVLDFSIFRKNIRVDFKMVKFAHSRGT